MWLDIPTERLMQANNDTGIDISKIELKLSDAEKVKMIKRIQAKFDIYEAFDEFVEKVRNLELTKTEKDLIINLLDYIYMTSYQFTPAELEQRDKMKENNNDQGGVIHPCKPRRTSATWFITLQKIQKKDTCGSQ